MCYYDKEKDEIRITLSGFKIKISDEGEIEIPHNIFLIENVYISKNDEIKFDITLQEEYLKIIEKFLEKKWFTFDSKNYYRSDDVNKIIYNEEKEICIINPNWREENNTKVLISYKNIIENITREQKLLLEKDDTKLKSFKKIDDLKKYILK
jgi:hypothetical protein